MSEFPGALVLVTHDRYLLDRLCTLILGFDGQGGTAFFADCEQWLDWLQEKTAQKDQTVRETTATPAAKIAVKPKPGKLSYMEQREYDQMEERILTAEAELEELQARMVDPAIMADAAELAACWQRQQQLSADVEQLYQRWSELEERKNG